MAGKEVRVKMYLFYSSEGAREGEEGDGEVVRVAGRMGMGGEEEEGWGGCEVYMVDGKMAVGIGMLS